MQIYFFFWNPNGEEYGASSDGGGSMNASNGTKVQKLKLKVEA